MQTKYIDLVEQTFDWPQEEFRLEKDELFFHDIPLMDLVKKFGSPLKFTYLPKIGKNIQRAKEWFRIARNEIGYEGEYHYCYCTKSSHFRYVLEEALRNQVHIETSSAVDIDLIRRLGTIGEIQKTQRIICNGFKKEEYVAKIMDLHADGYKDIIAVIDNKFEYEAIEQLATEPMDLGIRIASEEEPKFEFYTSRLGIGYREIVKFYKKSIHEHPLLNMKMLHFFINSGIKDTAYHHHHHFRSSHICGWGLRYEFRIHARTEISNGLSHRDRLHVSNCSSDATGFQAKKMVVNTLMRNCTSQKIVARYVRRVQHLH